MADIEKIKQVVALIEKDEAEHAGKHFDMACWVTPPDEPELPAFCNTAMCFAGWAVIHKVGSMERFLEDALARDADGDWVPTNWADFQVSNEAEEYLGLTSNEAFDIFLSTGVENSRELKQQITDVLDSEIWDGIVPGGG